MRAAPTVVTFSVDGTSGRITCAGTKVANVERVGDGGFFLYVDNDNTGIAVGSTAGAHFTASAEL
jgi:hypothetical protein